MFSCRCFPRTFVYRHIYKNTYPRNRTNAINYALRAAACTPSDAHTLCSRNYSLAQSSSSFGNFSTIVQQNYRNLHTSVSLFDDFHVIHTPPFADSITEGDVRWDKDVGDSVEVDEVIGEIETDKTALPIQSPCAGVIAELLVEDGSTIHKGDQLVVINTGGGGAAPEPKAAPEPTPVASAPPPAAAAPPPAAAAPPPETPPAPSGKLISTTAPTPPPPPPPAQARRVAAAPPKPAVATHSSEVKTVKEAPTRVTGSRVETKVKMNKMRQRIAERLKEAQNTNAMLTTFNEIDMSNAMEMRKKYKDIFMKSHNLKLGFMSAFIKGSAVALQQMPTVNAVIDDNYVVYRDFVDISVAVATPKGLLVPVLRDVHSMNFADVERGMSELGEKARTGNISVEDMDGGTFTISNGGVFGSLMGTPIINPPQSAILGMHGIFDRPVAINGKVEIRPMMYVALTYDHRLIDEGKLLHFYEKSSRT